MLALVFGPTAGALRVTATPSIVAVRLFAKLAGFPISLTVSTAPVECLTTIGADAFMGVVTALTSCPASLTAASSYADFARGFGALEAVPVIVDAVVRLRIVVPGL
jgi:hypothetical protein